MNGPSRVRIYQRTQVFRQFRSLLLTKNDSAKHILRIRGQGVCTEDTLPAPQVASNPQLFLPLPHHSRFINHSQVLGVVVVDFVHVYLETHPVFPLYQIPLHRPYCAIVPVVVCSVIAIAVASAAVVPVAVVPAAPVVSEPLDAPPGLVAEVVSEPVSTYTPLKR